LRSAAARTWWRQIGGKLLGRDVAEAGDAKACVESPHGPQALQVLDGGVGAQSRSLVTRVALWRVAGGAGHDEVFDAVAVEDFDEWGEIEARLRAGCHRDGNSPPAARWWAATASRRTLIISRAHRLVSRCSVALARCRRRWAPHCWCSASSR